MTMHNHLAAVTAAALLAGFAAGPALAQLAEDDAVIVDPDVDDVEIVDPEVEVVEPEVVEPEAEAVAVEPDRLERLVTASQIQDGPIYSIGNAYDKGFWDSGQAYGYDEGYETIGEIDDVVLDHSGQMVGIIAEVGGFLGLGECSVMLPIEDIRLVAPGVGLGAGAGLGEGIGLGEEDAGLDEAGLGEEAAVGVGGAAGGLGEGAGGFGEQQFAYVTRLTEEQLENLAPVEGYDD